MLIRCSIIFWMLVRLSLAADTGITVLRPPDLSKLSQKQFQDLLSKGLAPPLPEIQISRLNAQKLPSAICSIPLLKGKVDHPERFAMPRLPAGRMNIDPMATATPAPECPAK